MESQGRRWALGMIYIFLVATIWISASYIVQSVVSAGVSPFLVTYICNSLFMIYLPIIEISRCWEDSAWRFWCWSSKKDGLGKQQLGDSDEMVLLGNNDDGKTEEALNSSESACMEHVTLHEKVTISEVEFEFHESERRLGTTIVGRNPSKELDEKGRWTRLRVARVSLLICPIWFLAQLTFNLSLKYTTVTSNTILSSSSSLFTFLVSLALLGEKFTCFKLLSVLLCMGGTIFVSLNDSKSKASSIASNPLLGDILSLASAVFYSIYITLIRKKMPNEDNGEGQASMAQFLGYVGLFNLILFLPIALVLNSLRLEPFHMLSWKQFGLIVGKGLLDNVLSDYLWAKAVLLTSPTATTAGLTIQVPLAAIVDTITGHPPGLMNYIGAAVIMVGFIGINIPSNSSDSRFNNQNQEAGVISMVESNHRLPISGDATEVS